MFRRQREGAHLSSQHMHQPQHELAGERVPDDRNVELLLLHMLQHLPACVLVVYAPWGLEHLRDGQEKALQLRESRVASVVCAGNEGEEVMAMH